MQLLQGLLRHVHSVEKRRGSHDQFDQLSFSYKSPGAASVSTGARLTRYR